MASALNRVMQLLDARFEIGAAEGSIDWRPYGAIVDSENAYCIVAENSSTAK